MKVLFLDIDGVCNNRNTFRRLEKGAIYLDAYMCFMVGKIQLDTGCEVVLSSAWRHYPPDLEAVQQRIVKLFDVTPIDPDKSFRGEEINMWLKGRTDVEKYAILDDESDFYDDQPLFKTSFETGLTEEIAKEVTEYLNAD